jgi:putative membrane protein insertion efficiency factor
VRTLAVKQFREMRTETMTLRASILRTKILRDSTLGAFALRAATQWVRSLIRLYQTYVSPLSAGTCRFEPSCSCYADLCFTHHGFFRATYLSARRILRCNPLFAGGIDLPPLPKGVQLEPDYARIARLLDGSLR